jgi:hypothetical protein
MFHRSVPLIMLSSDDCEMVRACIKCGETRVESSCENLLNSAAAAQNLSSSRSHHHLAFVLLPFLVNMFLSFLFCVEVVTCDFHERTEVN